MRTAHELRGKVAAYALSCALTWPCSATAMLAVGAGSASAVILHLASGKPISYQPLRGASAQSVQPLVSANLLYHGGPVMTSNTNYAFYWAPSGSPAYPAEYQSGVNQYLEDLAHDSGGGPERRLGRDPVHQRQRRSGRLRLAFRRRDRRHRPVSRKTAAKRPRSASPTPSCKRSSTATSPPTASRATSRTSTSCSRRRASKTASKPPARNARPAPKRRPTAPTTGASPPAAA